VTHYELAYVLDPDLAPEELESTSSSFISFISDRGGAISASTSWGKRRLAYEINRKREGCYFFVQFEAEASLVPDLTRQLKLSDKVMRHMIIRLDERYLAEAEAEPEQEQEPPPEEGAAAPEAEEEAERESEQIEVEEATEELAEEEAEDTSEAEPSEPQEEPEGTG
jgi:small subunit ribosomal protein S6